MTNFRKLMAVVGTASFLFALSAIQLRAASSALVAYGTGSNPLLISYWVNETFNGTGGAPSGIAPGIDDTIYIVNDGESGGNLCADIYVWDPSEEEVSCCSKSLTPNELDVETVSGLLTNPASAKDRTPHSGVVKIISSTSCDPTNPAPTAGLVAWMVHYFKNASGTLTPTETPFASVGLSTAEENLNKNACAAFAYLSGAGTCTGPVEAPAVVHTIGSF